MLKTLDAACTDARGSQQRVLKDILTYSGQTVYGQAHGFPRISNGDDYAEAVPVNSYDDLQPLIARHERGEQNVLFPGKPLFYATTSGTTAAPKRIPISRKYHDSCYNGLSNLWLASMFKENPRFMNGYDVSMVGKAVEGHTADGTSYGSFSGHMNAYAPAFVKRFRVLPFGVHDIDDYPSKYYTIMRIAMEVPIAWIVAANPSTLLELHRFGLAEIGGIIKDIFDGTLDAAWNLAPEIRTAVEARLRPNPRRARELERLYHRYGTDLLPKHYWPSLQIINTWKRGNAAVYLNQTKEYYPPRTVVREFGYLATEARAGIVLTNDQQTSILAGHLLYFEFVHRSELNHTSPSFLQLHQVEKGEQYGIYITTPSGLYRYDMNDIVQVEDFYGQFPMVRFVQKGAGATSLTGEKLYESQYLEAMAACCQALDVSPGFHMAFANIGASRYDVYGEFDTTRLDKDAMAMRLDIELKARNVEYAAKRDSNRLKAPCLHLLRDDAFRTYKNHRIAAGMREGQFKICHLQQNDPMQRIFANELTAENIDD